MPPILDYDHGQGVSVTGGYRYRGSRIPALAGVYLYTDFSSRRVWGATVNGSGAWTSTFLLTAPPNISGFGEDDGGELFALGYFDGVLYRIVAPDADGDGLPDWWEAIYFGSATAAVAGVDSDGDGILNCAEYAARSDPIEGQSVPVPYAGTSPAFTSGNALVCTVGTPCSTTITATGAAAPALLRTGTLPAGPRVRRRHRHARRHAGARNAGPVDADVRRGQRRRAATRRRRWRCSWWRRAAASPTCRREARSAPTSSGSAIARSRRDARRAPTARTQRCRALRWRRS